MEIDILESIRLAKAKWNAIADLWNPWESLGVNEKIELVAEELRDPIYKGLVEIGDAE